MRSIFSYDPGKATGAALFVWDGVNEPHLEWSGELGVEQCAPAMRYFINLHPDIEIVCERFVINAQTVRNTQAPYSIEQIGIMKQVMRDYSLDPDTIKYQSPADAKTMFPNPKLKKLGYWHKGGEGHALDAIRHGLLYLARTGWKPTGLLN